jgi:hypothetical protein
MEENGGERERILGSGLHDILCRPSMRVRGRGRLEVQAQLKEERILSGDFLGLS